MTTAFDMLLAGQFLAGLIYPYTNLIGNYFYVILYGLGMVMLYFQNEKFAASGLVGTLVAASVMTVMPPEIHFIIFMFLAMVTTVVLYRVFH